MVDFIKKKYEVEAPDEKKVYGKGECREDYDAAWKSSSRHFLVGLPGSGRRELAGLMGEKLELPVAHAADAAAAKQVCEGGSAVVVVDAAVFDDPETTAIINRSGKVFYLMTDANTLARRLVARGEAADEETVWQDLCSKLEKYEPLFMGSLHFILQGVADPADLLDDALEKVAW